MLTFERFRDRFALGVGVYIGSWGVHIYLDFWQWFIGYESDRKHKDQLRARYSNEGVKEQ